MGHHNRRRISTYFRLFFSALLLVGLIFPAVGCGGGSSLGHIGGILTDGFGAVINDSAVVLSLDGAGVVGHPNTDGSFLLSAEPGNYTFRASFINPDAGFRLEGSQSVTLVVDATLELGFFKISNNNLDSGWALYRQGQFAAAETAFLDYLDNVRSGQVNLGSSSVFCGLGWTRGRGFDNPVQAANHFQEAVNTWSGNLDGWVGLAASELGAMKSDGSFHFNQALNAITSAIDIPGEYSSTPTHDQISEIDLRAYRSFLNLLNGNPLAARDESLTIDQDLVTDGNSGSAGIVSIVMAFTE